MCNTETIVIVAWLFLFGGAVGSFMNVVVYRLPLGISIVSPPSHCPKCGKLIPWYDNVPILGWIFLRGRCRQCRNPISMRYPVVEAVTAAMFAAVAAVELPYMNRTGFYGIYPCHMLLLCTLLCAGLIEYDGNRVPWRLFAPALAAGVAAALLWPKWPSLPLPWELPLVLNNAVDGLAGLVAGVLAGGIACGVLPGQRPIGLMLGLICVGLLWGPVVVAIIALVLAILIWPLWLPEPVSLRLRVPNSLLLCAIVLVWIPLWAMLASA